MYIRYTYHFIPYLLSYNLDFSLELFKIFSDLLNVQLQKQFLNHMSRGKDNLEFTFWHISISLSV